MTEIPINLKGLKMVRALLTRLFELEKNIADFRASELWTWQYRNNHIVPQAFGSGKDVTESNALQLWSCVTLSLLAGIQKNYAVTGELARTRRTSNFRLPESPGSDGNNF